MGGMAGALTLLVVFVGVLFASFAMLLARRYKRCPSNCVLVIYGRVAHGLPARCLNGGATFVWPLIQDYAYLSLEPIQIEIPLQDALSLENIRVNVPSVFTVAIGTSTEIMQNAAIRLLGLSSMDIKGQAQDIIFGQLRQVIASMSIHEINRDRDKFLENIQSSLEPELSKIGLVLINVNITDITDASGYIEAIGRKAASQAIQQARGDVADQEKMGEIRVAEAEREKMISVAEAHKTREIGIRQAAKEQAVRVAELAKEQTIGERQADFGKDIEVKNAERDMRVRTAEADAAAVKGEKEADRDKRVAIASADATAIEGENQSRALVAASNAGLQVKQAEAYQVGETRKREAEAAVLEAQNLAMAKAAKAEAERIEQEQRAQVEAPAKAQKAKTIVQAEADAEKRRIEATGEASAIFARLEAEARGQYEMLAKKAEGLKKIVESCGGSQEAFQLLMLEHLDSLANASAKAISNIAFDKIIVWENGLQDGKSNTASFLNSMARTLPPMLQVMRDVGGVEIPEYLAKLTGQEPDKPAASDHAAGTAKPEEPKPGKQK